MKLVLLTACGLVLLPQLSLAYEVTDTNVTRLNQDTVLFSITYDFGFLNRDMLTPMRAVQGQDQIVNALSYQITSANTVLENVFAPAVVLTKDSDVSMQAGQYYLPRGERAEFTLIGLLRLADTDPTNALRLEITHLPYITINGDAQSLGAVLPSELPTYRTSFITLMGNDSIVSDPGAISIEIN